MTAVEYDAEATADLIRRRCAPWLDDSHVARRPTFGVREVKVGLRRRRMGLLHVGAPIRHRAADVDAAVEVLAGMLAGMAERPAPGEVFLELRTFVRDGRAALLALPARVDFDERVLAKAGVSERPLWRAAVDPSGRTLRDGRAAIPIAGIVVADASVGKHLDDLRRHLWKLAQGDLAAWARTLDAMDADELRSAPETEAGPAILALLAG